MKSVLLKNILLEIKRAADESLKPRVVFDLDSTLFCVSSRTQVILRELAEDDELISRFPLVAPQLKQVEVTPKDWGIRGVLIRHQIAATLEFFEILRAKWSERFFSSHYLQHDLPYPGAVEFVKQVSEAGASVYYLTGRDRPRMEEGTLKVIKSLNLPLQGGDYLKMKPDTRRHDAEFKLEALRSLDVERHPSWFFENEPVIINLVKPQLPNLKIILVDSVHSGRETAPTDLPKIAMNFK